MCSLRKLLCPVVTASQALPSPRRGEPGNEGIIPASPHWWVTFLVKLLHRPGDNFVSLGDSIPAQHEP